MTPISRISDDPRVRAENAHDLFHRLWTKACDAANYDKAEWLALGNILTIDLFAPRRAEVRVRGLPVRSE